VNLIKELYNACMEIPQKNTFVQLIYANFKKKKPLSLGKVKSLALGHITRK
jgi:hypothetical protein